MRDWLSSGLNRLWSNRHTLFGLGFVSGLIVGLGSLAFARLHKTLLRTVWNPRLPRRWSAKKLGYESPELFQPVELVRSGRIVDGIAGTIGNTPLIRINSLSELTGCEILGKAEFLNPGGSPKDRVALEIISQAEESGELVPNVGSWIFEGTVGSTGISIAMLAHAKGYNCCIVVPDDVAEEKVQLLRRLGASVEMVRPRGIVDPRHFVNEARARASAWKPDAHQPYARAFFADQFESEANFSAHYNHTGPEIWEQTSGRLDAFVSGAGTGGTISGVAAYLKRQASELEDVSEPIVVAADPTGSGVYNRVKYGVLYNSTEAEGTRRRHQVDSVVEGIGLNRLTRNLDMGLPYINDAIQVTDDEAVRMSRYLASHDGLFLGSSSAVHCVAAAKVALRLKSERTSLLSKNSADDDHQSPTTKSDGVEDERRPVVVTVLCDSGSRHLSKFQNDEKMKQRGLEVSDNISDILGAAIVPHAI
ncbi:cysteine synthase [Malassezia psittaci]|uniref:cysteine synthase n=1 Tax=Malassezia psittaci TaxID=1821823 RepID=A0AAF0F2Y3_9BASI|nr:cysteine synthase [Malassezia psittaci]